MNISAELKNKHQVIKKIRDFFDNQGLFEVQTPILLDAPITDVYIDSLTTTTNQKNKKYLHTSPEIDMKKLISRGSGDIYQICKVFRDNEFGVNNFNEFVMLEYYRIGFDIFKLMSDIDNLLKVLGFNIKAEKLSYAEIFGKYTDIDILNTDFKKLQKIAISYGLTDNFNQIEDLQIMLFVHLIEPNIKDLPLCFIYDYPAPQAALARIKNGVAKRFELYINGSEIANGYDEVQTASEYKKRFIKQNNERRALKKFVLKLDNDFLSQLQKNPLPQCSGVAIGIDRLLSQIVLK